MSDRIPRLSLDELAPELAEKLRPRVSRLCYLGEFFACAGHQPAALAGFVDFSEALKQVPPAGQYRSPTAAHPRQMPEPSSS